MHIPVTVEPVDDWRYMTKMQWLLTAMGVALAVVTISSLGLYRHPDALGLLALAGVCCVQYRLGRLNERERWRRQADMW